MPNNHRQKTAGSPEPGLPALNLNAADGYENQLSATAEIIKEPLHKRWVICYN